MSTAEARDGSERPLIGLSRLAILVHPLFMAGNAKFEEKVGYKGLVASTYQDHSSRANFIPQNPNDLLLIMPKLRKGERWREAIAQTDRIRDRDPKASTWTYLYLDLREESPFPNKVRLVKNFGSPDSPPPQQILLERLKSLGFELTESTEIILGGEWFNQCLELSAKLLLELPQVRRVKIDKRVSIDFDGGSIPYLGRSFRHTDEGRYLTIERYPLANQETPLP